MDEGRYLLLDRLGSGGFATVWKALDRRGGGHVAVKVLHGEIAGDVVRRERFFRGARMMAGLTHDAVTCVIEAEREEEGWHYVVMEFVDGGDLRQAVIAGRVRGEAVMPVILRVGGALAVAHARGVIHRDIKPANILLDASLAPKMSDFDLVGAAHTTGGTRTGGLGTFLYAAPELMQNAKECDARADVYGLGMTAIFGLKGAELDPSVLRAAERFIDELRCGDRVKDVLKRAVAWEASERFKDAGELCEALGSAWARRDDQRASNEPICVAAAPSRVEGAPVAPQAEASSQRVASTRAGSTALRDPEPRGAASMAAAEFRDDGGEAASAPAAAGSSAGESTVPAPARFAGNQALSPPGGEVLSQLLPPEDLVRDMRGENLDRTDLSGVDLIGADLRRASLVEAKLAGAWLSSALLERADLTGASLLSAAFSPDGLTLASASADNSVRLWSIQRGCQIRAFEGHGASVGQVAFSPQGTLLASASDDGTLHLWHVATGRCLAILLPCPNGWAAFTPDGRYKLGGDVAGSFWHVIGLCRFEPGELDPYIPGLRLADDEPFVPLAPDGEPRSGVATP